MRPRGPINVRAGMGRTIRQEEQSDTTLGYPSPLTSVGYTKRTGDDCDCFDILLLDKSLILAGEERMADT
jgi:hypothetical protein